MDRKVEKYCISNVSELRNIGTTNFFRYISEGNGKIEGVVYITNFIRAERLEDVVKSEKYYIKFNEIKLDKEEGKELQTITSLLNNLKIKEIKNNIDNLYTLIGEELIVRAETEVTDYRNNKNPKYYKAEIVTDTELLDTGIKKIEYREVNEVYKDFEEKSEQFAYVIKDTDDIESEGDVLEIPTFETNPSNSGKKKNKRGILKGKIKGF